MAYNEKEKNHQGVNSKEEEKKARMYAQPGDPMCPLESLKLYMSKLNLNNDTFFQRPKRNNFIQNDPIWYENSAVGTNTIGSFMKTISQRASLSQNYTNHGIRATTATALHRAGLDSERISHVTGHRNLDSLKHYIKGPSEDQTEQTSSILHKYGHTSEPMLLSEPQAKTPSLTTPAAEVGLPISLPESARDDMSDFDTSEALQTVPLSSNAGLFNVATPGDVGALFPSATFRPNCSFTINFNAGRQNISS